MSLHFQSQQESLSSLSTPDVSAHEEQSRSSCEKGSYSAVTDTVSATTTAVFAADTPATASDTTAADNSATTADTSTADTPATASDTTTADNSATTADTSTADTPATASDTTTADTPDTTADLKSKVKEQSEEILNVLPSNDDWRLELRYIVRDVCELDLTIGANGSLTKAIKKIISDSGQIHTADQRSKDKLLSHVIVEITSVIEAECTTIVTSKVSSTKGIKDKQRALEEIHAPQCLAILQRFSPKVRPVVNTYSEHVLKAFPNLIKLLEGLIGSLHEKEQQRRDAITGSHKPASPSTSVDGASSSVIGKLSPHVLEPSSVEERDETLKKYPRELRNKASRDASRVFRATEADSLQKQAFAAKEQATDDQIVAAQTPPVAAQDNELIVSCTIPVAKSTSTLVPADVSSRGVVDSTAGKTTAQNDCVHTHNIEKKSSEMQVQRYDATLVTTTMPNGLKIIRLDTLNFSCAAILPFRLQGGMPAEELIDVLIDRCEGINTLANCKEQLASKGFFFSCQSCLNASDTMVQLTFTPAAEAIRQLMEKHSCSLHSDETTIPIWLPSKGGKKKKHSYQGVITYAEKDGYNGLPLCFYGLSESKSTEDLESAGPWLNCEHLTALTTDGNKFYQHIIELLRSKDKPVKVKHQLCCAHCYRLALKGLEPIFERYKEIEDTVRKAMQEAAAQQTGREDKDSCQIDESKYEAEVEKVVVEYIRSLEVEQPALYWGLVFAAAMHSIYQLEACVETIWNLAIIDAHKQDPEACWLSPEQRQPVLEQVRELRLTKHMLFVEQCNKASEHLSKLDAEKQLSKALHKSNYYYVKHKDKLWAFINDPALSIDNNCAERKIKKFIVIRKLQRINQSHERLQLGCNYFTVAETFKELGLRVSDIKDFALFMHDKLFTHTLGCLAKEWAAGDREIEFDAMVQQCSLDRFLDSFPYGKHMMDFLHAKNIRLPAEAEETLQGYVCTRPQQSDDKPTSGGSKQ